MSDEFFTLIFLMFLHKSDLRISIAVNKHERIIRINTKPGKTAKYNFHIIDQIKVSMTYICETGIVFFARSTPWAAIVHLNFRAGSTFPVPVCTVLHGHWVNKANNQQD